MFLCHALKANGRPCRAYASVLEESVDRLGAPVITYAHTCRHHDTLFDGAGWIKKFLGHVWHNRELTFIPHRHVEYVLSSGAVQVTEADVAAIEVKGYTWYLYVLLARHVPGVCRQWNTALCEKAQEMIWRRVDSIGPLTLTYADLGNTLHGQCRGDQSIELFLCLGFFPQYSRPELSRESWLTAICLILLLGPGEEILTSPYLESCLEMMKGRYTRFKLPILESLLQDGSLAKQLLDERAALYEKCIRGVSVSTFRDELLAVTWEPSRVLDWCADFDGDASCVKR